MPHICTLFFTLGILGTTAWFDIQERVVPNIVIGIFILSILLSWLGHRGHKGHTGDPLYRLCRLCPYLLWFSIGCLAACIRINTTHHSSSPYTVDFYATDNKVTIEGVVVDEPDRRPLQTKYTIEAMSIRTASGETISNIEGKVLMTDRRQWPKFAYRDPVEITGKLQKPGAIDDFQYDRYLRRFGVFSVMYRGSIKGRVLSIEQNPPQYSILTPLYSFLFSLKQTFEDRINQLLPEPHASFLAGLLTGTRKGIPKDLTEHFNRTGLTHIIAISGYNITIIITIISSLLFWLPLKARLLPSTIAIACFVLFVGASAAVVRAGIMGFLGLLALQTGRQAHARTALAISMSCMVLYNPPILLADVGFQLSCLSVLGLIELSPRLEPLFVRIPKKLGLRESLLATICAQIATGPLVAYQFGRLSLIAPLANLLVVPLIPLAMLLGFLAVMLGFVSELLGLLVMYPVWGILEYIVQVATVLSEIPYASILLSP